MVRTGVKMGLLLAAGVVVYVSILMAQTHAAANLCESHPVGSTIEDPDKLDATFFLSRMGPLDVPENPGTRRVIFCAALTMCDTSCRLEIKDGMVTDAKFTGY